MSVELIGAILGKISEVVAAYKRENAILRTLLQDAGLSSRQISGEIRKRLRRRKILEPAEKTLARIYVEISGLILRHDEDQAQTIKDHLETDHSKMN